MVEVTAIVPAYNEGERIDKVLKVLDDTSSVDEIIAVNDGSTDNTEEQIKSFDVKYLENEKNRGKAYSMEKGVRNASDPDIIFFCDADLTKFSESIVEDIIKPVKKGETAMFIGIRANVTQRLSKSFALLSGERALKKEVWDELPDYYKDNFKVETGLNHFVKEEYDGFMYEEFDHYQTLKERKYGLEGLFHRFNMLKDIVKAFIYSKIRI